MWRSVDGRWPAPPTCATRRDCRSRKPIDALEVLSEGALAKHDEPAIRSARVELLAARRGAQRGAAPPGSAGDRQPVWCGHPTPARRHDRPWPIHPPCRLRSAIECVVRQWIRQTNSTTRVSPAFKRCGDAANGATATGRVCLPGRIPYVRGSHSRSSSCPAPAASQCCSSRGRFPANLHRGPHTAADGEPTWAGESICHWEDDTLVVRTTQHQGPARAARGPDDVGKGRRHRAHPAARQGPPPD